MATEEPATVVGDAVPGTGEVLETETLDDEIVRETLQADEAAKREGPFRRLSRKLTRPDSLDVESMRVREMDHATPKASLALVLNLAFQSIGVVYGDLGTSPLYVYSSTFTNGIKSNKDILGVLSLIIYTIMAIPLIKYIFIVLRANDNGEGPSTPFLPSFLPSG